MLDIEQQMKFLFDNISFLTKLKEEDIMKEKFNIGKIEEILPQNQVIQGKWIYHKTTTNFNDAINVYKIGVQNKEMPKNLIFSNQGMGTDLNSIIQINDLSLFLNNKHYDFLLLNFNRAFILYESLENNEQKNIEYHVYKKVNDYEYSLDELKKLISQNIYRKVFDKPDNNFCYDNHLDGTWELYDSIEESQLFSYLGKEENKDCNKPIMYPMFSELNIKGKCVGVIKEGDSYTIKGNKKTTIYNHDNAKMELYVYNSDEIFIYNPFLKERLRIIEKTINNENFLFVDIDLFDDLNNNIFVYKRTIK